MYLSRMEHASGADCGESVLYSTRVDNPSEFEMLLNKLYMITLCFVHLELATPGARQATEKQNLAFLTNLQWHQKLP